jgi:hypothetical protein
MPGLSPGARIKKTIPGKMTSNDSKKNHGLRSEKFNFDLLTNDQFWTWSLISPPPVGINKRTFPEMGVSAITLIKVLLTVIAVNMLTATPTAKVTAKP